MNIFAYSRFSEFMHCRGGCRASLTLFMFGMALSQTSLAIDLSDTVQMHGFASQAYISTSDNRFFGRSDEANGSADYHELGLNLSWRPVSNLQLAAQGVSRKAGESDDGDLRLDYGLLDYSFLNQPSDQVGVRLGRYKNPIGFYNLTRDVPNTRPSILLPESLYSDEMRNIMLSLDGGQVYGVHRSQYGDLFLDVGTGDVILEDEMDDLLDSDRVFIGRLLYEYDGGRLRLAMTSIDATLESDVQAFPNGELSLKSLIYSVQYNAYKWSLTGEYQPSQDLDLTGFFPLSPDTSNSATSYYLQGTYRVSNDWEVLLRYDVFYSDKDDKSGDDYAAATGLPAYSRYAKDRTVGLTWNVTSGFMLRAEYHAINGTAWLSTTENPNPFETEKNWNLFALQASYQF